MVRQNHPQRATALARLVVLAVTLAVVMATATPFTVGVASAAPTPITQCTDITQPGRYVFANDIIDATPTLSDPCIEVFASDVHIDGAGYTLDGTWTGGGTVQYGIFTPPFGSGLSLTNVSVTNLTFTDLGTAINFGDVSDFEVSNNTFTTSSGVLTRAVQTNTGTLTPVTDGRIADNRMLDVRNGVLSNGLDANVVIERNEIILESQGRNGISVGGVAGVTIASNTVDATAATRATGIRLTERFSGQSGVNDISSNVVTGAETGVFLRTSAGNSVTTELANNTVSGSTEADFVNNGDDTVTVTDLTLDTGQVTFDAQNALVSAADPTPTPPSGLTDIGQFVAAGSYFDTRPSSFVLTVRYQDADVSDVDESALALYEYNVSTGVWVSVPGGAADAAGNVVGPVSVPLEQARFEDDDFNEFIEFQQVLAPLAPPSETTVVVDDSGDTLDVLVTNPIPNEPLTIPLSDTTGDVQFSQIEFLPETTEDIKLTVIEETEPSAAPALVVGDDTGPLTYLTVTHTTTDEETGAVTFTFDVSEENVPSEPSELVLYRFPGESFRYVDQGAYFDDADVGPTGGYVVVPGSTFFDMEDTLPEGSRVAVPDELYYPNEMYQPEQLDVILAGPEFIPGDMFDPVDPWVLIPGDTFIPGDMFDPADVEVYIPGDTFIPGDMFEPSDVAFVLVPETGVPVEERVYVAGGEFFEYDQGSVTPENPDGLWTPLPTEPIGPVEDGYRYEATSTGFSTFAVAPTPPVFTVLDADVSPTEVVAGDPVTVTGNVTNDGGAAGTATLVLTANGVAVTTTDVTVGPGETEQFSIVYTIDTAGTYELAVDGVVAGTVLVKLPVDIDVQPDDSPNELPPSPNAAVPVAVLGSASFDPGTELDVSTVRFGAESVVESGGGAAAFSTNVTDVNGDGIDDLVLVFKNGDTGLDETNTLAVLTGETNGGLTVYGTDAVTVKTKGKGNGNR